GPEGLTIVPDAYRNDPANRSGHGTSRFEIRHLFEDSAGRYRLFRFVVDDTHAATYGVLRVVYVEELLPSNDSCTPRPSLTREQEDDIPRLLDPETGCYLIALAACLG